MHAHRKYTLFGLVPSNRDFFNGGIRQSSRVSRVHSEHDKCDGEDNQSGGLKP